MCSGSPGSLSTGQYQLCAEESLGCLQGRLDLSICLAVSRTAGVMFKLPCPSKRCKLVARELWPIVGHYFFWTSVSGEVVLEFQDDGACLSVR